MPLFKSLGIGVDGLVVLRKSHYSSPLLKDVDQRNREARIYIAWDLGH